MVHSTYMLTHYPIQTLSVKEHFPLLTEIPHGPEVVYVRGCIPPRGTKYLTVVGSRNYSDYGKRVVEYLISGLRGYPLSIISGLAIGIDSLVHTVALASGLHTISVPGSGLDESILYPQRNRNLAKEILEQGGALLSEFEPHFRVTRWSFPKRNRIMAGLSHAVLLIEAGEKSGTLITGRLATDFNRELLVVPGGIFSMGSQGVHQFLKLGATPVTTPEDIVSALNLEINTDTQVHRKTSMLSKEEFAILTALSEPKDHNRLIRELPYPPETTLILLTRMELLGVVQSQNGIVYKTL